LDVHLIAQADLEISALYFRCTTDIKQSSLM